MHVKSQWERLKAENRLLQQADLQYKKVERFAPLASFVAGFLWDSFTLSRIDQLTDNLVLLLYLLGLNAALVLSHLVRVRALQNPRWIRFEWLYPLGISFFQGGLFSAYVIYYFQSASLSKNLVFVVFLCGFMLAAEFLKHRLGDIRLQLALYFVLTQSFWAFFFPILLHKMGHGVYIFSGIFSFLSLTLLVAFLFRTGAIQTDRYLYNCLLVGLAMFVSLESLYLAGWIPPVPLSMKSAGVYHTVEKKWDRYRLGYEPAKWYQPWHTADPVFHFAPPDDQLVGFFSIFAPQGIEQGIVETWLWFDPELDGWRLMDTHKYQIQGGRDGGWRTYYIKKQIADGLWKVELKNQSSRLVGRVEFEVQQSRQQKRAFKYVLR